MRILHTSDWHVGRTFHGQDLLGDQRQVLAALAELVRRHAVDVVAVPGDLYDRAVPSVDAVGVLTAALGEIRAAGAQIVATAGNHDSAPRLGAFADFLAAGGLHLRTAAAGVGEPVLIDDEHGPVAFYPLPYLEPEVVRRGFGLQGRASHQAVMTAAMDRVRTDLSGRPGARSVVLAHAFVVGAVTGGSERSIAVGGVESVTADVFDGVDYVALGHLHRPQTVTDRIRYCGSPLAYSFNEAGQSKGALLIELDAAGATTATPLPLPVPRPMAEIGGTLAEVLAGYQELVDHYLSVRLTDPVRPLEAMRRLKAKFPYALTLQWEPPAGAGDPDVESFGAAVAAAASDAELIADFLDDCRGVGPSERETAFVDQAIGLARAGAAVGR
ncbi:exonuclease SbcCD subunit D [Nakamurella lactea]|uniref:exonuclease SbcCD subunit D n=1 Tax=Nakamurella lactea TaxID=459515 RepID=UPI00042688B3|nr:exonuclease SbcCD subunit D [Nakamurella lactea]